MTQTIDQLPFEQLLVRAADRAVSTKIRTPVVRWRKMVRLYGPRPGDRCSRKCFQSIAAALADYADRNGGSCFPPVERIVEDTDYSERQVQYALASLEGWGLLRRSFGGRGRTTRYQLICRQAVDKPVDAAVGGEQLELERVRETTLKGCDPSHPMSVKEDRQFFRTLRAQLST